MNMLMYVDMYVYISICMHMCKLCICIFSVGEYHFKICDFYLCCICLTLGSCITVPV